MRKGGRGIHFTGRECMRVAQRGRSDISTPTVCHSGLPMMYGCYMAQVPEQNQSIWPCRGTLLPDNGRLWPLLWNDKNPWGCWGKGIGLKRGMGRLLLFHITQSAFPWYQKSCKKHIQIYIIWEQYWAASSAVAVLVLPDQSLYFWHSF